MLPAAQEAEVRLSIAGMFAISPDVRAETGRQALALPGLPEHLRARHLAVLFHNLVTAGRVEEARAILGESGKAVQAGHDAAGRFVLELAESGLMYADGRFGPPSSWSRRRCGAVWALATTPAGISRVSGVVTCLPRSTGW